VRDCDLACAADNSAVNLKPRQVRQAGAIPVRRTKKRSEVCLLRKQNVQHWNIPKGTIEFRHTARETALKETWEEAGLKGRLVGQALGTFEFEKWGDVYTVEIFLMEVHEEYDEWPESNVRERRWTSFRQAKALLEDHPAGPLLDRALDVLDRR
jgi:8-oxo-dGTP pyrophosphatase MutT (NUDIX family)